MIGKNTHHGLHTEIFPLHSAGITSARDAFSIDFNQENLYNRISDFITMKPELAREKYSLGKDVMDWKVALAQEDVKSKGISRKYIQKIQYRIWDWRYGNYTGTTRGIMCMQRKKVMENIISGENIGLVTVRKKPANKKSTYFGLDSMVMNGTIRSDSQSIDYLFHFTR